MFTGIVKNLGQVQQIEFSGLLAKLTLESNLDASDVALGDSIAINGVCLTVTKIFPYLCFDLGVETLEKTTLSSLRPTQMVHFEKAMRFSDRLGGHLVQGHVDGIGIIVLRETMGDSLRLGIACHPNLLRLCVYKGSICIDGISLTINNVNETGFEAGLIPHTLQNTCLAKLQVGDRVNIENDLIGKYVGQLFQNNEYTHAKDSI